MSFPDFLGNLRAGGCPATFLRIIGRSFRLTQDDVFDLNTEAAAGTLDLPDIAARLHPGSE